MGFGTFLKGGGKGAVIRFRDGLSWRGRGWRVQVVVPVVKKAMAYYMRLIYWCRDKPL